MKTKRYNPFLIRDEERKRRYEAACKQAAAAVDFLYSAGAGRVILFGSILRPDTFDERSDIDIAVEGISDVHAQFLAEAALYDFIRDFDYDVVFLDDANAVKSHIREAILREGKVCSRS